MKKETKKPDQMIRGKRTADSSLQEICCGFIGDVRDPGQQEGCISVACVADGIAAAGRAYMAVDSSRLISLQLHKLLYQIN